MIHPYLELRSAEADIPGRVSVCPAARRALRHPSGAVLASIRSCYTILWSPSAAFRVEPACVLWLGALRGPSRSVLDSSRLGHTILPRGTHLGAPVVGEVLVVLLLRLLRGHLVRQVQQELLEGLRADRPAGNQAAPLSAPRAPLSALIRQPRSAPPQTKCTKALGLAGLQESGRPGQRVAAPVRERPPWSETTHAKCS